MNGDHEAIHLEAIDGANTTHLPHALYEHHFAIYSQRKWFCIKSRQCDVPNVHYFHYSKKFMDTNLLRGNRKNDVRAT